MLSCISSLSTKSSLNLLFSSYDTYMTFTLFLCITFFFLSRIVDWKIKQIDMNLMRVLHYNFSGSNLVLKDIFLEYSFYVCEFCI